MKRHQNAQLRGWLLTALGVLALSPDGLLVRLIDTTSWTLLFWRGLLMGCALLALSALWSPAGLGSWQRVWRPAGFAVAGLFCASTVSFVLALHHTTVANTLVIISATPLFAALYSRLWLAESVAPRTWVAMAVALGAIGLILGDGLSVGQWRGNLAAVAAAASLAGTFSVLRRHREVDMLPAMGLGGLLIALIALAVADTLVVGTRSLALLLFLCVVLLPLAFSLITLGPRYLSAPEVSLIMLLETALGPLWVWWLLGEAPPPATLLGGSVLLLTLIFHALLGIRLSHTATNEVA